MGGKNTKQRLQALNRFVQLGGGIAGRSPIACWCILVSIWHLFRRGKSGQLSGKCSCNERFRPGLWQLRHFPCILLFFEGFMMFIFLTVVGMHVRVMCGVTKKTSGWNDGQGQIVWSTSEKKQNSFKSGSSMFFFYMLHACYIIYNCYIIVTLFFPGTSFGVHVPIDAIFSATALCISLPPSLPPC